MKNCHRYVSMTFITGAWRDGNYICCDILPRSRLYFVHDNYIFVKYACGLKHVITKYRCVACL